jgi:hypothetical protein
MVENRRPNHADQHLVPYGVYPEEITRRDDPTVMAIAPMDAMALMQGPKAVFGGRHRRLSINSAHKQWFCLVEFIIQPCLLFISKKTGKEC